MTAIEFNQQLILLQSPLKFFANQLTHDEDDAKDLLQETLTKALTYKSYFKDKSNLKAWLYTIMKNTFINHYRKKTKFGALLDKTEEKHFINKGAPKDPNHPETTLAQKEILKEISQLDPTYRISFELHVEGYKYKEISDELNIPVGTVKSRIFQARKKLMQKLEAYK